MNRNLNISSVSKKLFSNNIAIGFAHYSHSEATILRNAQLPYSYTKVYSISGIRFSNSENSYAAPIIYNSTLSTISLYIFNPATNKRASFNISLTFIGF